MGVVAVMLAIHTRTAQIATICDMAADVADSDTVTFLDAVCKQHRGHIGGTDFPERMRPFGLRSKQYLERLITHKTNRYGRYMCKVRVQPVDCSVCYATLPRAISAQVVLKQQQLV